MLKTSIKNSYEVNVILKPTLSDDEIEKNVNQVETTIKNGGGTVTKIDEPVRRRFTHKIGGAKEGFYISFLFNAPSELPNTLKRNLSISDDVLRHIIVKKAG